MSLGQERWFLLSLIRNFFEKILEDEIQTLKSLDLYFVKQLIKFLDTSDANEWVAVLVWALYYDSDKLDKDVSVTMEGAEAVITIIFLAWETF